MIGRGQWFLNFLKKVTLLILKYAVLEFLMLKLAAWLQFGHMLFHFSYVFIVID
jgi:hypothetical protein